MKTILLYGVFQLVAVSVLAIGSAIWYANREKVIEALSCAFIAGMAGWLGKMIHETLQMM